VLRVLLLGLLVAACAPTAAPGATTAPPKPAAASAAAPAAAEAPGWQAEWDRLVAAARQEGKVVLFGPPGAANREAMLSFQKAYPEIQVELTGGQVGRDLVPRLLSERQAGQYLWDVYVGAPSSAYLELKPTGAVAPLRPALLRPEVLDESKWLGGFQDGWMDLDHERVYAFSLNLNWTVYVNRQLVPANELREVDELWDPKWKGKIAMIDPSGAGPGARVFGTLLLTKGEDKVRALFQQDVALTRDGRQHAEWLVRGRYPIALAISPDELKPFQEQGVPLDHVQPLISDDPAASGLNAGRGAVVLLDRAPHPNAARLFVNWLLGPEAQRIVAEKSNYNSRRTDVPPVDPERQVDPTKDSVNLNHERHGALYVRARELAAELVQQPSR
jgi:iron(III) transport system substrate-binding protein